MCTISDRHINPKYSPNSQTKTKRIGRYNRAGGTHRSDGRVGDGDSDGGSGGGVLESGDEGEFEGGVGLDGRGGDSDCGSGGCGGVEGGLRGGGGGGRVVG